MRLAAALASMGCQVGAAMVVAVVGTVVAESRAKSSNFSQGTHPSCGS